MLAFCAACGTIADVEVVRPDELDVNLDRPRRNGQRFRFELEMARD